MKPIWVRMLTWLFVAPFVFFYFWLLLGRMLLTDEFSDSLFD